MAVPPKHKFQPPPDSAGLEFTLPEMLEYSPSAGRVLVADMNVLMVDVNFIVNLRRELGMSAPDTLIPRIFRRVGSDFGRLLAQTFRKLHPEISPIDSLFYGTRWIRQLGFPRFDRKYLSGDPMLKQLHLVTETDNSVEARAVDDAHPVTEPTCHLQAGVASGMLSELLGFPVFAEEVTCKACGHDVCTFDIRSEDKWGDKFEEVKSLYDQADFSQDLDKLKRSLKTQTELAQRVERELSDLRSRLHEYSAEGVIVHDDSMTAVLHQVETVAPLDAPVLVMGESGTGKEVIARLIHERSSRGKNHFYAINCAAIPENLLEAELFGYKKGAFTGAERDRIGLFEAASQSTLFLDEIGEMSAPMQAKLLRVLQEGSVLPIGEVTARKVNTRVIAATNRELRSDPSTSEFREDLFFRLSTFTLRIPPLRNRPGDIVPLIEHFMHKVSHDYNVEPPRLTPSALRMLVSYEWPGNVRELYNVVQRITAVARGSLADAADIEDLFDSSASANSGKAAQELAFVPRTLKSLEREHILDTLKYTKGNRGESARLLGISTTTLWRMMKDDAEMHRVSQ